MKKLLQQYYETLTDEELKIASDYIVQQQGQLALMSMCAREERLHREYIKEKRKAQNEEKVLKKVRKDVSYKDSELN